MIRRDSDEFSDTEDAPNGSFHDFQSGSFVPDKSPTTVAAEQEVLRRVDTEGMHGILTSVPPFASPAVVEATEAVVEDAARRSFVTGQPYDGLSQLQHGVASGVHLDGQGIRTPGEEPPPYDTVVSASSQESMESIR